MSQSLARFMIGSFLSIAVGIALLARVDAQNGQATHQKLAFDGEMALWTVAIKPDKTADFEQVMLAHFVDRDVQPRADCCAFCCCHRSFISASDART